ncbi:MAG: hypothetical protein ACYDCG_19360 [Candidatus Acidiferrales bacterium]
MDAASCVVSIIALALITNFGAAAENQQRMTLLASIREGIANAVKHSMIRSLLMA